MDLTWRPLAEKDIPAWAELLRAVEAADRMDEHYSEEDLAEEFAAPGFDSRRGSLAAFDGPDMVAGATLRFGPSPLDAPTHRMPYDGYVHPAYRGRGLGTRLLAWAPDAARALHAEHHPHLPLDLNAGHGARNEAAAELIARQGFTPNRYYNLMKRDLGPDLPPVPALDGIAVLPYAAERDEETRAVKNAAFRDHWGSTPWSAELWRSRFTESASFRPDLSFIAVDQASDRVVGMVITKYYAAETEATGRRDAYVDNLGTLRDARGRGVGGALLAAVLHEARARGFDSASLGVDTQNPTGALGVYERAGLHVYNTWISYSKRL
jgi:mycothiol synthase